MAEKPIESMGPAPHLRGMLDPRLIEINPDLPPLDDDARAAIAALARRQADARGLVMTAISFVGGRVEGALSVLPKPLRKQFDKAVRKALARSYDLAGRSRGGMGEHLAGDRTHRVMAAVTGAVGGVGGIVTALAELPVATTVIFRAVQDVAESYGEDTTSEETRLECLSVFGAGGPGDADDGIDTSFVGARLALTGSAVNTMIARVAPRFAAMMGQKLATQSVPLLGAAAGVGTNLAFTTYYVEMAHVHFGLRRLMRVYGEEAVTGHFHAVLDKRRLPRG